jgi:hypothetical protein
MEKKIRKAKTQILNNNQISLKESPNNSNVWTFLKTHREDEMRNKDNKFLCQVSDTGSSEPLVC